MATIKELFKIEKDKKNLIITSSVLAGALALGIVAGVQFKQFSDYETYFYVRENVQIEKMSDYSPNLKNTVGDTNIYKIQGEQPGPSVLIIGGTHPNEPSGQLAATLLLENIEVERGTVYILTEANKSAYTHSHPLEATTFYYHVKTQSGQLRKFKFGSRATNTNQQWPNPDVYTTQTGQKLSSNDTRNLNRAYPGKINGTYTEQVAYGIVELIKQNDIAVTIDLHEASPEYVTINAIVAHDDAIKIASNVYIPMLKQGVSIGIENSPTELRGLSHRELGDNTDTLAFLCETSNAAQGKIRGAFTEDLIINGQNDKFYKKAIEIEKELKKTNPEAKIIYGNPVSLTERVARHVLSIQEILKAYNAELEKHTNGAVTSLDSLSYSNRRFEQGLFGIESSSIPTYQEIMTNGVGQYLANPQ